MVLTVAAEEYKLLSGFEDIRKRLLSEEFADRLEKPLAYWALPNDRRLPLAFLGRSLRDLLHTPFEELSATPGIGQKKIASLVRLLHRAAEHAPPKKATNGAPIAGTSVNAGMSADAGSLPAGAFQEFEPVFEPSTLSEGEWEEWRETVRRHRLGQEKLGRLAGSLQNLPTVIWHKPLSAYLDFSLSEMRRLKTHGEKRIRAVLEVFYDVHRLLGALPVSDRLSVQLRPAFIAPMEAWLREFLAEPEFASSELVDPPPDSGSSPSLNLAAALHSALTIPILHQIEVDSGSTVRALVEGRLGVHGAPQTVRHQSRRMGVTRARVYQLLDDCAKVADVRWPEGKGCLAALGEQLAARQADPKSIELVAGLRELLFPEKFGSLGDTMLAP